VSIWNHGSLAMTDRNSFADHVIPGLLEEADKFASDNLKAHPRQSTVP
jgi:hypothetical protein